MMRLVVCATLMLAAAFVAGDIYEKPGHTLKMQRRLGHFAEAPLTDIYRNYAKYLLKSQHERIPLDDPIHYRPSAVECVNFLRSFRTQQYKLDGLHKFIQLDACLGYLYQSPNHDKDREASKLVDGNLDDLIKDKEFNRLWTGTQFAQLKEEARSCVGNLLYNDVLAKSQFPSVVCNHNYIQVYLNFAECQQKHISEEQRKEDSYLKSIYELLMERGQTCVETEVQHTERAVRTAFAKALTDRAVISLKQYWNPLVRQQRERMWPKQVITLLAAAQNTTTFVNLREVHKLIRGVSLKEEGLTDKFLDNFSYYATKKLEPKGVGLVDGGDDASGMRTYQGLVDKLCSFFRTSDDKKDYDFVTPIIRLVRMLKYPELFGINVDKFAERMVGDAQETAPVYIGVGVCNILTFTQGYVAMPTAGTKQRYVVEFKPDTTGMVLWPQLNFY